MPESTPMLLHLLLLHIVLSTWFTSNGANLNTATTSVATTCGTIIGKRSNQVDSYEGIPYAVPPERWMPSELQCLHKTFDATHGAGPACFQKPKPNLVLSEDCLHLNVYAPAPSLRSPSASSLLPVMVYLHGGSLVEGSSVAIQSGYGGPITLANRSNSSVVSVSLNYRLGVLGFLSLQVLERDSGTRHNNNATTKVSGNYGLLDVLTALRWVQTHIASFGGDPRRVTVYGQSSGGSLVFALMTSPYATGLFSRAISMSGSPRLNSTVKEAEDWWHPQVVDNTLCNQSRTRKCLRALQPKDLVAAQPENWDPNFGWSSRVFWDSYRYAPLLVIDGDVLPNDYRMNGTVGKRGHSGDSGNTKAFPTPLEQNIPLIIGVTREEIDFAPGNDVRNMTTRQVSELFNVAIRNSTIARAKLFSTNVLHSYGLSTAANTTIIPVQGKNATSELIFSDFISDATMLCGTYVLADAWSKINSNIYMYTVSQRPGRPFCALSAFQKEAYCPLYSFHAIDMFALYDWLPRYLTPKHLDLYNKTDSDVAFTRLVRDRLVDQFAWHGEVRGWGKYSSAPGGGRSVVVLNAKNERTLRGWREQQCALFLKEGYYESKAWVN